MNLLLAHYNKLFFSCLVSLLVISCGRVPVQPENSASRTEIAAEEMPLNYGVALELMKNSDYATAILALRRFINEQPEYAGPYINLGIAYRHTGDTRAALNSFHKALELNPSSAPTYHQLAILYREQGDFKAALQAYKKALALNPDYALAHHNIGILYDLYLQQPKLALQHYQRFLELSDMDNKNVRRWVVDLKRRTSNIQASTAP